jgi:glutamine synthetase
LLSLGHRRRLPRSSPYFASPHGLLGCGDFDLALESLEADNSFLLKGDVFNKDFIESYSALKWEEVYALEHTPHPIEYQMYYSG